MKHTLTILALFAAALLAAQPRFTWPQLPAGTAQGQIARTGASPYNGQWVDGQAWVDSILYARGTVYGTGSAGYLAEWLNDSTLQADPTGAYLTSVGTTAQRPTGAVGLFRYNTTEGELEFYGPNTSWWSVVRSADYALTSGSVLFADANGAVAEDNAGIFYSESTDRFGLGTASPQKRFHVAGTNGANQGIMIEGPTAASTSASYDHARYQAAGSFRQTWYAKANSGNLLNISWKFYSDRPDKATRIRFIDGNDLAQLEIYPATGQFIRGVVNGKTNIGVYSEAQWNESFDVSFFYTDHTTVNTQTTANYQAYTKLDSANFLITGTEFGNFKSTLILEDYQTGEGTNFSGYRSDITEDGTYTDRDYHFIGSKNATNNFYITADGEVGIGNAASNPARSLHVAGEVRITDLTTDTPTLLVGADGDGDLNSVTVGSGLTLSGGSLTTAASYVDGSGSADRVATWADANTLTYGILHDDGATVGINTAPDATTVLYIQDTVTQNTSWYGNATELIFTPASNTGALTEQIGNWIYIHPDASNANTVASLEGIQVTSQGMGSGNVTQIYGIRALASTSTTTTNLFGVYVDASVETGATATNRYILYLSNLSDGASPSGANYSLYNASSLASYFAGNVGIKTTGAAYALDMGSATGGARLPNGTTAQRPTGANGVMRYNSTTGYPEVYYNSTWNNFGGATTWLKPELEAGNDVNIASNNAGISITAMTNLELEGSDGGGGYAAYYIDHDGINRSITMELGGQDGNFSIIQLNDLGSADPELAGSIASILAQGASATYAAAVSLDSIGNVYVRTDGGDVFFYNYDDTKRDSAAHLMGIQEATGKLVPIAQVNAKYIEDTDLTLTAAEIYKFQEARVWMSTTAGATSQTELTIPDAAAVYLNTKIVVVSKDASGTYNNLINTPGSTMYDNGSDASSYVVAAGATVVLWCVQTGSSTYRWAIQQ